MGNTPLLNEPSVDEIAAAKLKEGELLPLKTFNQSLREFVEEWGQKVDDPYLLQELAALPTP